MNEAIEDMVKSFDGKILLCGTVVLFSATNFVRFFTKVYEAGMETGEIEKAQQRQWVGLSAEEIFAFDNWQNKKDAQKGWVSPNQIVAYIEAKLKEKNT